MDSPLSSPLPITDSPPWVRLIVTGRTSATPSLTTKTYGPWVPSCMAGAGMATADGSMPRMTSALTNWPGHSVSPALAKVALAVTVPVLGSTLFSMKDMTPDERCSSSTMALTCTGPFFMAARRSDK